MNRRLACHSPALHSVLAIHLSEHGGKANVKRLNRQNAYTVGAFR